MNRPASRHRLSRSAHAPGLLLTLLLGLALLVAEPLAAQAQPLAEQRLGRAYWHVFAAFALAWLLVLGWVFVIARRLGRFRDRTDA